MKLSPVLSIATLAALAADGCGGGAGSSSATGAHSHTSNAGNAVLTYFGDPKPFATASAGSVTTVAQAGATYSSIQLQPAPNLDTTSLVLGRRQNNITGIYKLSYPNAVQQLLYQTEEFTLYPGASVYGNIAFYDAALPGNSALGSIKIDGSGFTSIPVTGLTNPPTRPRFATDGTNRMVFTTGSLDLEVAAGTGGAPTQVQTNTVGYSAAWNPSGTKLIYSGWLSGNVNSDLFTIAPTGGVATDVTPPAFQNTGLFTHVVWSPDGSSIAADYYPSVTGPSEIILFHISGDGSYTILTPLGDDDTDPIWSPDGSKLAFYRGTVNGATSGIYTADPNGLNTQILFADPSDQHNTSQGMTWTPFLPKETVVAASGATFYHKPASGFVYSQNKDQFGSFVAFTANTPSSASIQSPTNTGSGPLIFTMTADSITSLGYVNSYFSSGTTLTLTSTPTVLVSVDATTGQVDTVAPAADTKPMVTKNADGSISYKAAFKAIYDGSGTNRAPNGASQLTVNPKNGKLLGWKP